MRRIRWHCYKEGASTLTDRLLDEAESTVSQGAKELICRLNQSSASFRKTSENLKRAAQLESNAETIRQLVEGEGKAVLRALGQGSDNPWREFRLVAHYDETQSHCHVSVTRGNHEAAGRLMARDARSVGLHDADERIANVDGAPWLQAQLELHGTVDHIGLDFYHLSEYVHAARRDVFTPVQAFLP